MSRGFNVPPGLKPSVYADFYGTAEAVPFQNLISFTARLKPCPFKTGFMRPVLVRDRQDNAGND